MALNHEHLRFQRMPRGRNQMPYYGQCSEQEISHMSRGPCFSDNYGKMDGSCGMGVSEFKSPMMNADPAPPPPKKKKRGANAIAASQPPPSPVMQDLLPPPLTGYGDTIVASNPFDDTPPPTPSMSHMNPMGHVNKHMAVGPCMSPAGNPMMGSMSPCQIVGSPMACGPPVGSPINIGPPMGNCSPMSGAGNNGNCGPVGSPLTSCSNRQVNRSPLVCPPMSQNSVMNNAPMNVNSVHSMNRSPSNMGSPLSSVMASNVRGNSPLDCGLGVGSQKGSPMSVMGSHGMNSLNCGSPMGSPSNVPMNSCNSGGNMMGSPVPSPLSVPCSMSGGGGGADMNMNMNNVMNRSPMNVPPNSVNASMMCNSSMRGGPSPLNSGPMNGPMSMNCNQNMNMGSKADMNMNELALRETCGPGPGHMSMKANNGPCGMPVNNVYSRQPDMGGMQCGPMSNMHCGPMMNNQCGPGMNNVPCMPGGVNRPPCGPGGVGPMGMNNPYDNMNPQCRPPMNRSQFVRGMHNMPYGGGPNSMNAGPMNGPGPNMNGPNMNMCGPPDMGNMPCGPNNGGNVNMHCRPADPPMNNSQCMGPSMNQCSGPMFNSQFGQFEGNDPRCSPNLPFTTQDMGMNNSFYRTIMSNAPCMPNMNQSVSTHADTLGIDSSIMSSAMKNDCSTVDSDIASVVCNITHDTSDDLTMIDDNLLQGTKPEDSKSVKDLLLDDSTESKDDELNDSKPNKNELDCKLSEEKESKLEGDGGKTEPSSTPSPTTAAVTSSTPTTSSCTPTLSNRTSITTTSVTNSEMNVSGEEHSGKDNADDEFSFKKNSCDSTKPAGESNEHAAEDILAEDKIKNEPDDKLLQNEFNEDEDAKNRDEKLTAEDGGNGKLGEENATEGDPRKENTNGGSIKVENDEFFDGGMKPKMEPGTMVRGNNGFNNGNMMQNAVNNFNMSGGGEMPPGMMNNSGPCMNDTMCGSPMMPMMNRMPMPQPPMNNMNYPNRGMNMFPTRMYQPNKSKMYNMQNPNAPPVYTCGQCHKEINDNDEAILCESGCNFWFHRVCCGLTEDAYRLLRDEIYAEWACDKCMNKSVPLVKLKP